MTRHFFFNLKVALVQRCIVFQLEVRIGQDFSMEIRFVYAKLIIFFFDKKSLLQCQ